LSSKVNFRQVLRRLKPERHTAGLRPRNHKKLSFIEDVRGSLPKLLLDTTVYIDELQGCLPESVEIALRAGSLWHSTVTEAELSALAGLLNPAHPDAARAIAQVVASIERRPDYRTINPDRLAWQEAGVLAGLLARLQGYRKGERRKALNDALIFLSATKAGCTVLTRNISDFDLLMQLDPQGSVFFYQRSAYTVGPH
jgi:predicted nucleic acid-binding protein